MKNSFKPLALAAAVAGLAAGTANAQPPSGFYPSLGDAAFVPYYTVNDAWVTGVHIINTSTDNAVVVKIRLRRAGDSLDILDFNLVLSPEDVWTGTLSGDETEMKFVTEDNSCTAPELLDNGDGKTFAPVFGERLEGAQEGYIEVIGMGEVTDDDDAVWVYSKHGSDGVPADCDIVRQNFFIDAIDSNSETSIDPSLVEDGEDATTFYGQTDNVLKVSYFIRDAGTGIEFGKNAMHFQNFSPFAMMTHQQFGLENYSQEPADALIGWDFPDVRGGGNNTPTRNSIFAVRNQLGAVEVMNDWSYNPATGAATDWVVTFPGQYALEDFYLKNFGAPSAVWDYREIPVTAEFSIRDREEDGGVPGGLNFSPSPAPDTTTLEYEVNVIEWGGLTVLNSEFVTAVDPRDNQIDSPVGWARLAVDARPGPLGGQNVIADGVNAWCDVAAGEDNGGGDVASVDGACDMYSVSGPVPMVGFAAWERTFAEDNDRNYGRIIEHSFTTSFN